MHAYSLDLRERVVADREAGLSTAEVARKYRVSPAGVRQAIEVTGAQLPYLPPYSPDFNPSEQGFAKLKARHRALAPRTVASLWAAVGPALSAFSPTACAPYVRHAGYRLATLE